MLTLHLSVYKARIDQMHVCFFTSIFHITEVLTIVQNTSSFSFHIKAMAAIGVYTHRRTKQSQQFTTDGDRVLPEDLGATCAHFQTF
jgi:hypothetical protein